MHQKTFHSFIHHSTAALELVHLDVWGPASSSSIDGYKYFLSIVDDYTKYTWLFPLVLKSEVCSVIDVFIQFIARQFRATFKAIQRDNGGEFKKLRASGVNIRHSCPYTHQQNGLVERKHQHITKIGLVMLSLSKLSVRFWWHAFSTIAFLINVLPTPVLHGTTPFQKLFHKTPDYLA